MDANHVGGDVSWTPPENDAGLETYETYLATDAAGSGGALTVSMAVGTNSHAQRGRAGDAGGSGAGGCFEGRLRCFLRRSRLGHEPCRWRRTNEYAVPPNTDSMGMSHHVAYPKSTPAERTMAAALALTDVSKSVSAVSFGGLDLKANHVGGDVSWIPPKYLAGLETYETYLATDAARNPEGAEHARS